MAEDQGPLPEAGHGLSPAHRALPQNVLLPEFHHLSRAQLLTPER